MAESKPDKLDVAARCISSTIRWAAARGRAAELAKQVYFKYSSEAHDKPYYYNSLLQTTTWKKPKLLWKFDVPYEDGEEKEELGTMGEPQTDETSLFIASDYSQIVHNRWDSVRFGSFGPCTFHGEARVGSRHILSTTRICSIPHSLPPEGDGVFPFQGASRS